MADFKIDLPILNNPTPPPRKSQAEKYGAALYLGLAGLVVLVALIGWFVMGAWRMRDVFREIYVLNDEKKPPEERIAAGYALSRDPRVNQRQRFDLSLNRTPPPLARYLLAESLTSDAVSADPRGYALAVARSEGWPDWLRLQLFRPLAYAAGEGYTLSAAPLVELAQRDDPVLALWVNYALAYQPEHRNAALQALDRAAGPGQPNQELAALLREAFDARQPARNALLNRATLWLREHHPDSARLWRGWVERDGRLAQVPAPELRG